MTNEIRVLALTAVSEGAMLIPDFENTLEAMQEIVGGYIEAVRITENIVLWVNEEGLLKQLPLNFYLSNSSGEPISPIVGDVLFTGVDSEGDNISLTDDDIKLIESRFINRKLLKHYK